MRSLYGEIQISERLSVAEFCCLFQGDEGLNAYIAVQIEGRRWLYARTWVNI